MVTPLYILTVGFVVSFFGSIPPGIINLTVMQMGIRGALKDALYFILGVAIIEFGYAFIAVRFSTLMQTYELLNNHLDLVAAVVLMSFGISNFVTGKKADSHSYIVKRPFLKGSIISLLNPLAITFWLGMTTYLLNMNILQFSGQSDLFYLLGILLGTVALLILVAKMSTRFQKLQHNRFLLYHLPGIIFIVMSLFAFFSWTKANGHL